MKKSILLVLLLSALTACSQNETATAKVDPATYSLQHKFAIVNAGHEVPETDPTVSRAGELLARANEQYGDSKDLIADMAVKGSNLAKEKGLKVSALEVLEATTLSFTPGAKFSQVEAVYLELRSDGQAHAEAMLGSKGMMKKVTPPS